MFTALTLANDNVLGLLRTVCEVVLEDGAGAGGVARLRIESRARVVWDHAVAAAEGVLHVTPWVVLGRGLLVPDVTSVAAELAALDSSSDILGVADGATSSVDCGGSKSE